MTAVRFPSEVGIFLFAIITFTLTLGPTQPPIHWVTEGSIFGVKVTAADNSPSYIVVAQNAYLHGVVLRRRDKFIFYFAL
jgi:hypothetical protein